MTRTVNIGKLKIGGGAKIAVQSMTNTDTSDIAATGSQLSALKMAGCDIARLAVSNDADILACKNYVRDFDMPLVADIQFDYRLAIKAADIGFSKIRFNPGNIGSKSNVAELVTACKINKVPIRIGVNNGSIDKNLIDKYDTVPQRLVASALQHVRILEEFDFRDIVISVKSSDVKYTVSAYRELSKLVDYPLHVGVTETGDIESGKIKSAVGIGSLLLDGIGDTIRVSLTADPIEEIVAAKQILRAVGLDKNYCEIISCPTCSRCKYNLADTVDKVKKMTDDIRFPLKIAVMGCIVNGPGEAKDADFGVAGGSDKAVLFKNGQVFKTVAISDILTELENLISEYKSKECLKN